MKVSLEWIEEYLDKKDLDCNQIAESLTAKSFEVEEVDESRQILDIDILPNRSHDCLCHKGIAKEVAASSSGKIKFVEKKQVDFSPDFESEISLKVEDDSCKRYIAVHLQNVKIGPSPEELRKKIESLGEKSINNIVDITNIVMFELGQPMHAFDLDKLNGKELLVRQAKNSEKMTTLDKKDLKLDETVIIISDSDSALAVAGVKGGNKAEVTTETVNIVLESANFDPTKTRLTSQKLGIKTESSKRFENQITPYLAEEGIKMAIDLIKKYVSTDETKIGQKIEHYPKPAKQFVSGVSVKEVKSLLGDEKINELDLEKAFILLGFEYEIVNVEERFLETIRKAIGKDHKNGASVTYDAPEIFDCSSLTSYAFSRAGIMVPRITVDQFMFGEEISKDDLRPGDLIFPKAIEKIVRIHEETIEFLPKTKTPPIDHVGVYMGDGKIVHSSIKNDSKVVEEHLESSQRFSEIIGYRRYFEKDEKRFVVKIPHERLDLINISGHFEMKNIDLIEEVGRIIGYKNIKSKEIEMSSFSPELEKEYFYKNKIRNILAELTYSEIMTYNFVEEGYIEPEKPLAQDKRYLRPNLKDGMIKALELNAKNADLLGIDVIKTFEIGKVFNKDFSEDLILCLGVANKNGVKNPKTHDNLKETLQILSEKLDLKLDSKIKDNDKVIEINLNELISKLPEPTGQYERMSNPDNKTFSSFSIYPFVTRDIAVWIPNSNQKEDLIKIIKENSGDLLIKDPRLFDEFEKDGRTSYAFRMVYQSMEKTLTDDEVNKIMEKIYSEINKKDNWEVR